MFWLSRTSINFKLFPKFIYKKLENRIASLVWDKLRDGTYISYITMQYKIYFDYSLLEKEVVDLFNDI